MSRILLIDDEPATRLVTHNRLKDLGHEVVAAENGAHGLLDAREGGFDLILSAAELQSGVSGLEVCRRLKQMPKAGNVPLVLYSKHGGGREDAHRAYEAGCDAFLAKADLALMDDVVRSMLRLKGQQDELVRQIRGLEESTRRKAEEKQRGADLEVQESSGSEVLVQRELAAGRPDGVLLVDGDGMVRFADRGARDLLGSGIEGKNLGRLAPASGLEAFVRDARTETREGFRFDLPARSGRAGRSLSATVMPLMAPPGHPDPGLKVVVLLDTSKRRVAAELMRLQEYTIPRREVGVLRDAARVAYGPATLLGDSPAMTRVRAQVSATAGRTDPLLISGEPGSGKQHVARAVHFGGEAGGPFLPLHCAGLAPDNLESEIFGHVKGVHAAALSDRPGLLHQASHGTLYLEGIEGLTPELQARLFTALRDGQTTRLGSDKLEAVEARVATSSSADLTGMVSRGEFHRELYEIISGNWIELPPLRERREDIPQLVQLFLDRYAAGRAGLEVSDGAMHVLESYDWPENVHELEDCIRRACRRSPGLLIDVEHLPPQLRELHAHLPDREVIPAAPPVRVSGQRFDGTARTRTLPAPAAPAPEPKPWDIGSDEPVSLELYEKKALLRAIEETGGDKLAAARLLKVGKSTLYRKLKRYGIA